VNAVCFELRVCNELDNVCVYDIIKFYFLFAILCWIAAISGCLTLSSIKTYFEPN
jgi:hypothetical protein